MRDLLELFCFVRSKGDHTHQAMQTIGAFSSTLAVQLTYTVVVAAIVRRYTEVR